MNVMHEGPEYGELFADGDGVGVRYRRRFARRPDEVWRALVEPASLADWLADAEIEPRRGGVARFRFEEGEVAAEVLTWDRTDLLELTWPIAGRGTVVRFNLHPHEAHTDLLLEHRRLPRSGAAREAAGWHARLDRLGAHFERGAVDALARRAELEDAYVRRLAELSPTDH